VCCCPNIIHIEVGEDDELLVWATKEWIMMTPLYEDPHFTFRFADDRIIPRFHLEGIKAGRRISVFKVDPSTGNRLGLLAMATVGEGGWVNLGEPIIVRAGEAFIAVPESMA
jgi:hypothetical protein